MKRKADGEELVVLNVGGSFFTTCRQTILQSSDYFPHSLLTRLFDNPQLRDREGNIFIDADPETFRFILSIVRRPTLIGFVPPGMTPHSWLAELDYWGLTPPQHGSPIEGEVEDMGKEIRSQISRNEEQVIALMLKKTGYYGMEGKTRQAVLYVPFGVCALPWGTDMALFIVENKSSMIDRLREMMLNSTIAINTHGKENKIILHYKFDGEAYTSTAVDTLVVKITFIYK